MLRVVLPLLALAACASDAGYGPIAEPPQMVGSITYSTSACFGACPVYTVEIDTFGQANFTGKRFTAASGTHKFPYSWEQYWAFRKALEPSRPEEAFTDGLPPILERKIVPGAPNCTSVATDMPTIEVVWREDTSPMRETRLTAYLGCDMAQNRALFDILRKAPDVLRIQDLIGKR